jgi:hypothetical protein
VRETGATGNTKPRKPQRLANCHVNVATSPWRYTTDVKGVAPGRLVFVTKFQHLGMKAHDLKQLYLLSPNKRALLRARPSRTFCASLNRNRLNTNSITASSHCMHSSYKLHTLKCNRSLITHILEWSSEHQRNSVIPKLVGGLGGTLGQWYPNWGAPDVPWECGTKETT